MKAAETALQEVNKELAKLEDDETAIQKDVVDVKNELEKYQNIIKENQQKIKHWKKEVSCWDSIGITSPPFRVGRHIVFARVICPSGCLSVRHKIISAL